MKRVLTEHDSVDIYMEIRAARDEPELPISEVGFVLTISGQQRFVLGFDVLGFVMIDTLRFRLLRMTGR